MYGLVLEGGGTRGAYQVGVYKALMEKNIEFGVITGTSAGGLNGAFFAMRKYNDLVELYNRLTPELMFEADDDVIELLSKEKFYDTELLNLINAAKKVLDSKGLDITPFKNVLKEYVDEDVLRNSGIRFGVVTIDLDKLEPIEIYLEDMEEGHVVDYLIATSSLPIFKGKVNGKRFLDGGFYDNLPIKMLIKDNEVEKVYVIRLYAEGVVHDYSKYDNLVLFEPSEDLGGLLSLNKEMINKNINMGYYDAIRKLEGHDGKLYTIRNKEEKYFLDILTSMSDKKIDMLADVLLVDSGMDKRRALFEEIIPLVAKMLKLKKQAGYKDIFIAMLERIAHVHKVDKYRVYDIEELVKIVRKQDLRKDYFDKNIWEAIKLGTIRIINVLDSETDKILEAIFSVIVEE